MHELLNILAQERDGVELLYVIAILLFSALGGLSEWIKKKRAQSEEDKRTLNRPRKPVAPPRQSATGMPHPLRPPGSRPQVPPRRLAPPHQRAPRAQPAQKSVPPAQPRHPARPPSPPQRGIPDRRPRPGQSPPVVVQQQPRATREAPAPAPTPPPPTTPPTRKEQTPVAQPAQPVRTAEMARQEVAAPRPNVARDLIFKPGQRLGREDWRRAVILNELFSPPVSLRSDEHLWDR